MYVSTLFLGLYHTHFFCTLRDKPSPMICRLVIVVLAGIVLAPAFSQTFTESNLPIVLINTNGETILDDPKIMADMAIIDNGPGVVNNINDTPTDYDGKIGIEIRGSSSQMFPKKQYGIELWDEEGEGIDASILGMPEEEDWVLFAPYNDKALIRDALAYKLGRDMGQYASRQRFCEVLLNGEYMGVFVFFEKVKRDGERVDIAKLDPDEVNGDDLTGGYIFKIDKFTGSGGDGWVSDYPPLNAGGDQEIFFQYEDPESDEIVQEQRQYIKNFMDEFEDVLAGEDFKDPDEGYAKYIDVESFVDYYIINELTKNVDAYRLSTFMHKQRDSDGGKLRMGPIWDFNLGFGNVDYCIMGNPEGFVTSFNSVCPNDEWLIPFWWSRLLSDPAFRLKLNTRWEELRSGPFATGTILNYVDSITAVLDDAQERNFERWPVLGEYVWPNYYVGNTYEQEVAWLKDWIASRLEWLDTYLPGLVTAVDQEQAPASHTRVYPNPFQGSLSIEYVLNRPGNVTIELTDMIGRRAGVYRQGNISAGSYNLMIDTSAFPSGMYLYKVVLNNKPTLTGKVFKP